MKKIHGPFTEDIYLYDGRHKVCVCKTFLYFLFFRIKHFVFAFKAPYSWKKKRIILKQLNRKRR